MVNTERMGVGRTMTLSWTPTRPGNWLFHCHDTAHIARALPLDGSASPASHHVMNHALEMMSGPVIGITVLDKTGSSTPAPDSRARRNSAADGKSGHGRHAG